MQMLLCFVLVCSFIFTFGSREADRVTFLPGLDPQPEFKHYAGYLQATGTKKLFYWFVESENNPAEDPVVLWLNGGPGCSSMTGFLVELGPWRVTKTGDGLTWFEQRWNKIANMIFLESPQCVGFSYAEDGNCTSGDDQSALDNHEALKDFFSGWPEYKNNEFFITGESYAGFYVPLLSARIVDDPEFNFKGFAVGNAVTDRRLMSNGIVPFTWTRGVFGNNLWHGLLEVCCRNNNISDCNFYDNPDLPCTLLVSEVNTLVWRDGLNPYNLYDECYGGAPDALGIISKSKDLIEIISPDELSLNKDAYDRMIKYQQSLSGDKVKMNIPCTDTSDRDNYLNNPEVREALHVPEHVQQWSACSSNVSRNYDRQYSAVYDQYHKVMEKGHRVLVFNGDFDMACDHLSDYHFVEDLNQQTLVDYRKWFYTSEDGSRQIAGFVQQYENIKFLTVKGAGHFVPTDKPIPAYVMWEKFLRDEDYP